MKEKKKYQLDKVIQKHMILQQDLPGYTPMIEPWNLKGYDRSECPVIMIASLFDDISENNITLESSALWQTFISVMETL